MVEVLEIFVGPVLVLLVMVACIAVGVWTAHKHPEWYVDENGNPYNDGGWH